MRAGFVLAAMAPALLLAACNREKTFDERYANATKAIGASAAAIDAEIASGEKEAAAVDTVTPPSDADGESNGRLGPGT
ncbi:MAG: hypothetical protein ABIT04_07965 [Novosphingobium sp.]